MGYYGTDNLDQIEPGHREQNQNQLLEEFVNVPKDGIVYKSAFGQKDFSILDIGESYHFRYITDFTGVVLATIYYWVAVVVLMRMLIAVISAAFNETKKDQHV